MVILILEKFKILECCLPDDMVSEKVDENTIKLKEFQQILLDSMIHHFVVDWDKSERLNLLKRNSLENLVLLGNDLQNLEKQRLLVIDNYLQIYAIKLS
jgi:hypothetical protein